MPILASKIMKQPKKKDIIKKYLELSVILDSRGLPIIVSIANVQNGALALFSEHINSLYNVQNILAGIFRE